jgi:hypothetical protein
MNDNTETLVAVFHDSGGLVRAVKSLANRGLEAFEALSPVPLPELDEVAPHHPSSVRWFTLLGCVAGAILGMAFQVATTLAWPIRVGGKPIVSWPAFVVVAFEMTILFGALATMAGLMINSKLPMIGRDHYHQGAALSDFALIIECVSDERPSIETLLMEAGAIEVKTSEPKSVLLGIDEG